MNLAAGDRARDRPDSAQGWGFYGSSRRAAAGKCAAQPDTFERVAELLAPEIARLQGGGNRGGTRRSRRWLARQSVGDWMSAPGSDAELAAGLRGLRGFFLADPERLSLLQLVDQFASDEIPGEAQDVPAARWQRRAAAALAAACAAACCLSTAVTALHGRGSRAAGRHATTAGTQQLTADYVVDRAAGVDAAARCVFTPALPDAAVARNLAPALRPRDARAAAVRTAVLEAGSAGRPLTARDQPTGAVWDGNEQQAGRPGILSLLAGGQASREVQRIIRRARLARAGASGCRGSAARRGCSHATDGRLGSRPWVEGRLRGVRSRASIRRCGRGSRARPAGSSSPVSTRASAGRAT